MVRRGKDRYPNCVITAWVEFNIIMGGGWTLDMMDKMTLDEFAQWYAIAIDTHNRIHG